MVKEHYLDGKKLFEEITYPDSIHHCFLVLEDGSYLLSVNNQKQFMGKVIYYMMENLKYYVMKMKNARFSSCIFHYK